MALDKSDFGWLSLLKKQMVLLAFSYEKVIVKGYNIYRSP